VDSLRYFYTFKIRFFFYLRNVFFKPRSAVCGRKRTFKYEQLNATNSKNFDLRKMCQFKTIPILYLVGIEIGVVTGTYDCLFNQ